MTQYNKPLPEITLLTEPFWQGIKDHQRTWSILQIQQMKEKNKDQGGLSQEKFRNIDLCICK